MPDTQDVISLDQQRAAYAWRCVKNGVSKDYANLAKSAPALIMNNGLMQTLAFYQTKGGEHQKLMQDVLRWLEQQRIVPSTNYVQAMNALQQMGAQAYRRATVEALEVLKWLRQLAPTAPANNRNQPSGRHEQGGTDAATGHPPQRS